VRLGALGWAGGGRAGAPGPWGGGRSGVADLKNGPFGAPDGSFAANSAWAVCAAVAYNLTRTVGVLASTFHAKTTTGTIRAQLIPVATPRLARSARRLALHLPADWPWETAWQQMATTAREGSPLAA